MGLRMCKIVLGGMSYESFTFVAIVTCRGCDKVPKSVRTLRTQECCFGMTHHKHCPNICHSRARGVYRYLNPLCEIVFMA